MTLARNGWRLEIIPEAGELSGGEISDQYDVPLNAGEPEQYHVTMPQQYHMRFHTRKKQVHDIRVRYRVTRTAE